MAIIASARSKNRKRRPSRTDGPLPHPSWRVASPLPDGHTIVSAHEFWARLGL